MGTNYIQAITDHMCVCLWRLEECTGSPCPEASWHRCCGPNSCLPKEQQLLLATEMSVLVGFLSHDKTPTKSNVEKKGLITDFILRKQTITKQSVRVQETLKKTPDWNSMQKWRVCFGGATSVMAVICHHVNHLDTAATMRGALRLLHLYSVYHKRLLLGIARVIAGTVRPSQT